MKLKKALEALIKLQDIDWQLQKLMNQKGDLPQKVESLRAELAEKERQLANLKNEISEKETRKKDLKIAVQDHKARLKKYQSQLYQVKNNKEYDAITVEIDDTQAKIDQNEFEILEIEESEESLQKAVAELEQQYSALEKSLEENKKELDVRMAKTHDEENALNRDRELVLVDLPKPVLNHYERIRKGRGGMAIALLQMGACSGCSSRIPPQRAMEVRNMNEMHLCETCGRILVWRPDLDPNAESVENETQAAS